MSSVVSRVCLRVANLVHSRAVGSASNLAIELVLYSVDKLVVTWVVVLARTMVVRMVVRMVVMLDIPMVVEKVAL
jgi:hypothetical protein